MCCAGMAELFEASQCMDLDRTTEIATISVYVVLHGSKKDTLESVETIRLE